MDPEELARKVLASFGAQPHEINQTIRDNKEIEAARDELMRYGREIMDLHGPKLMWAFARALGECFVQELGDDENLENKIQLVLRTIAAATSIDLAKRKIEKPRD